MTVLRRLMCTRPSRTSRSKCRASTHVPQTNSKHHKRPQSVGSDLRPLFIACPPRGGGGSAISGGHSRDGRHGPRGPSDPRVAAIPADSDRSVDGSSTLLHTAACPSDQTSTRSVRLARPNSHRPMHSLLPGLAGGPHSAGAVVAFQYKSQPVRRQEQQVLSRPIRTESI